MQAFPILPAIYRKIRQEWRISQLRPWASALEDCHSKAPQGRKNEDERKEKSDDDHSVLLRTFGRRVVSRVFSGYRFHWFLAGGCIATREQYNIFPVMSKLPFINLDTVFTRFALNALISG